MKFVLFPEERVGVLDEFFVCAIVLGSFRKTGELAFSFLSEGAVEHHVFLFSRKLLVAVAGFPLLFELPHVKVDSEVVQPSSPWEGRLSRGRKIVFWR